MRHSSFIFKENRVFIVEDKIAIVEEELDCNENLVGFPRLIFIDEECDNTQVDGDGGELTRKNNSKKKSEVLQAYRCQICDKWCRRNWGNHDFSCGYYFCV